MEPFYFNWPWSEIRGFDLIIITVFQPDQIMKNNLYPFRFAKSASMKM